jgi:hypothetical protein
LAVSSRVACSLACSFFGSVSWGDIWRRTKISTDAKRLHWCLGFATQSQEQHSDRQQNSDRGESFENRGHYADPNTSVREGRCQSSRCSGFNLTGDHPSGLPPLKPNYRCFLAPSLGRRCNTRQQTRKFHRVYPIFIFAILAEDERGR